MFNIINVACKQSAIGRVANVFSFVTTGRHIVLCFQRFLQYWDQTLGNVVHPLLYNFVKHFQRFYNGTNNITNHYQRIAMHCQCIQNALQRCFR